MNLNKSGTQVCEEESSIITVHVGWKQRGKTL